MKKYLLPQSGKFYKANLHNHTTVSDGRLTPEEAKTAYKANGYNIIAFTDHEIMIDQSQLNDDNFMAITSYEISIDDNRPDIIHKTCHLNLFSKDAHNPIPLVFDERIYDIPHINAIIKKANDNGYLVSYNHPHWSLLTYEDYAHLTGIWAVEAINYSSAVCGFSGDNSSNVYEQMLRSGQRLYAVATDDNHNCAPFDSPYNDSFGGFTMIKADKLDYTSIMGALENGNFYCSGRPLINELYIEDGKVHIHTSPVREITMSGMTRGFASRLADRSVLLTEAVFDINPADVFFRFDITDAEGYKAFSNAYFIDTLIM